jgi:hypothetical protein
VIKGLAPRITQKQGYPYGFVEAPMDNSYIKDQVQEYKSSRKTSSEFLTDTVNQCLTDDCKGCTGSYSNDLLHRRLLCLCLCHSNSEKASEEAAHSKTLQNDSIASKEGDAV